jgi:hypothetical protein
MIPIKSLISSNYFVHFLFSILYFKQFFSFLSELPAIWNKYFLKISEFQLYNDTEAVNEILKAMSTSPVVSCRKLMNFENKLLK